LLSLTKVASGQLSYDIGDIVVRDALGASVALVEPLIAQKQLVCDYATCDATIVASADLEKVSQILVNLLSNAIKFSRPGGHIARSVIRCVIHGVRRRCLDGNADSAARRRS